MPKAGKRGKKHKPQRTCVGCRSVQEKRTLIRIVRSREGVQIDLQGKLAGRGAYLHDRPSCWERGLKGRLEQALKTTLNDSERQMLLAFAESFTPNEIAGSQ